MKNDRLYREEATQPLFLDGWNENGVAANLWFVMLADK